MTRGTIRRRRKYDEWSYPSGSAAAKPVEAIRVDIGFLIAKTFYYGPENGFSDDQWQQLRQPLLYRPNVALYHNYLLSAELRESADELIRYYSDVLRLVAHHGKDIHRNSNYFWLRPVLIAAGGFDISFPWYDTWDESVPMLAALGGKDNGLIFHDIEQGWEFHAFGDENRLFLREGDSDSGADHVAIALDRDLLSGQIPAVRQRVDRVIPELSVALGRDYWSHH